MGYADRWEPHHTFPSKISLVPKPHKGKQNKSDSKTQNETAAHVKQNEQNEKKKTCLVIVNNEANCSVSSLGISTQLSTTSQNSTTTTTTTTLKDSNKENNISSLSKCLTSPNQTHFADSNISTGNCCDPMSTKKTNNSLNLSSEDTHQSIGLDETEALTIHTQYDSFCLCSIKRD
jgi:hypothetical protein